MHCRFGQSSTSTENDIVNLEGTTKNTDGKETEDELVAENALEPQQAQRAKRVKRNRVVLQQVDDSTPESISDVDTDAQPSVTPNNQQNDQSLINDTPIRTNPAIGLPVPASVPVPISEPSAAVVAVAPPAYDPASPPAYSPRPPPAYSPGPPPASQSQTNPVPSTPVPSAPVSSAPATSNVSKLFCRVTPIDANSLPTTPQKIQKA